MVQWLKSTLIFLKAGYITIRTPLRCTLVLFSLFNKIKTGYFVRCGLIEK